MLGIVAVVKHLSKFARFRSCKMKSKRCRLIFAVLLSIATPSPLFAANSRDGKDWRPLETSFAPNHDKVRSTPSSLTAQALRARVVRFATISQLVTVRYGFGHAHRCSRSPYAATRGSEPRDAPSCLDAIDKSCGNDKELLTQFSSNTQHVVIDVQHHCSIVIF